MLRMMWKQNTHTHKTENKRYRIQKNTLNYTFVLGYDLLNIFLMANKLFINFSYLLFVGGCCPSACW